MVFLSSACTPTAQLKTENYKNYTSYSFKLVDQRPAEGRDSEKLSLSVTNCAYGITRIGDEDTKPDRIIYLKNTLQKHRSAALSNHAVYVKKFTIHKNLQTHYRRSNVFGGGLVGGLLGSTECFAQENEPGGFGVDENPSSFPAVIIEITLDIGGRSQEYRVVKSEPAKTGLLETNADLVSLAMEEAMAAVLESLRI